MKHSAPDLSRGVNEALVTAATLVHFKAAALLGFALTISGLVVTHRLSGVVSGAFQFAGVVMMIAAACFAGAVIYPMKSVRRGGLIFWGDIATHASASAYADAIDQVGAEDLEREY